MKVSNIAFANQVTSGELNDSHIMVSFIKLVTSQVLHNFHIRIREEELHTCSQNLIMELNRREFGTPLNLMDKSV